MEYLHLCTNCDKEFFEDYSILMDPPTLCPLCGFDGKVKRLIQLTAPGRVELSGHDLKSKVISEGKAMARNLTENQMANVSSGGEEAYHETVSWSDKLTSDLKGID